MARDPIGPYPSTDSNANAKIGMENIKNDPHVTSPNGKLLLKMIYRQNLVVTNSMDICEGVITRKRITKDSTETSVIDYILVCQKLSKSLINVSIDEEIIHSLNRYVGKRPKIDAKFSVITIGFSLNH